MKKDDFDPKYYGRRFGGVEHMSDLSFGVEGLSQPEIDVSNIKAVMERVSLYFQRCDEEFQEPGVAGMCLWLGITTERWKSWVDGAEFNATHRIFCERVMTLLESRLEEQMVQGKINPVTAMFLLKSQHGYIDTPQPKKAQKRQVIKEMPVNDILKLISKK